MSMKFRGIYLCFLFSYVQVIYHINIHILQLEYFHISSIVGICKVQGLPHRGILNIPVILSLPVWTQINEF